jgi:hypothetical protein
MKKMFQKRRLLEQKEAKSESNDAIIRLRDKEGNLMVKTRKPRKNKENGK